MAGFTPSERNYTAGCPSGAIGIPKGLCLTYRNGQYLPLPYVYTRVVGAPPYWPMGVSLGDEIGSVAMGPGAEVEPIIRPYAAPITLVAGTGLVPVDSADSAGTPPALLAPGQWKPLLDGDVVSTPNFARALLMLLDDVVILGNSQPVSARAILLGWGSCIETAPAP